MKRVISRSRLDVKGWTYGSRPIRAASIVETEDGFDAVMFIDGFPPLTSPGIKTLDEALRQIVAMRDPVIVRPAS